MANYEHEYYYAWNGERRRWRYDDSERPGAMCYDCRRPYHSFGDMVVPNEVWEAINPTHHKGAGLLCPNCIMERLRAVDVSGVTATLHAPIDDSRLLDEICDLREQLAECQKLRLIEHENHNSSPF